MSNPNFIPRLAIIDDAEFDQLLYARLIRRAGNVGESLTFLGAEEAIAYFKTPVAPPVDVILLDINMPGMSGFDFLDNFSTIETDSLGNAIVVMLTTSLDPSDLARAKTYDRVKMYIHKPLQVLHLEQIGEMLGNNLTSNRPGRHH